MNADRHLNKEERLERLHAKVAAEPTITDDELAKELAVSIHTIRADRQKLGIPEARQRIKDLAANLYGKPRSLTDQEIVGELLEVEPDHGGLSLLETNPESGLEKSGIVRGHVLFALANSLAASVVDADVALTGEAQVKFISPVKIGERVLAKAEVVRINGRKREIDVVIKTKERVVFRGHFVLHGLAKKVAAHLRLLS